jgi:glycosyltransferase involved in cell wall biosynthesis
MKKICFLAFGSFPLLARQDTFYDVGGSELQQVLIGKELVKQGYEVIFIDFDYGQPQDTRVNGIRVIKTFKPINKTNVWEYGLHLHTLMFALFQADADIYYQRSGIYCIPLIFAKLARKPFVYAIPHDSFVSLGGEQRFLLRLLRYFDITYADRVVVQSKYQRDNLEQVFNRKSYLLKSICDIKGEEVVKCATPLVLWVATMREWKQPQVFLDLAKMFPDITFCMIGGPSSDMTLYRRIQSEAGKIHNLRFLGFIPMHKVHTFFEKAWVFVNTSTMEGFPNTFFHAWSHYTPVISLHVDPDEIICKNALGFHAGNFYQMVTDLHCLIENDNLRQQFGLNGRLYVEQEHNKEQIIRDYIDLFETIRIEHPVKSR